MNKCLYVERAKILTFLISVKFKEEKVEIIDFVTMYGLAPLAVAAMIAAVTGLIKMPLKALAGKLKNGQKLTRFIVLLPLAVGFGLTALWVYLSAGKVEFTKEFYSLWLSSVSASLAIYAVWEKFVPSEKRILSQTEIDANRRIAEILKDKLVKDDAPAQELAEASGQKESGEGEAAKKIILTNNKNIKN